MQTRGLPSTTSQPLSFVEPFKANQPDQPDLNPKSVRTELSSTILVPASQTPPARNVPFKLPKPAMGSSHRSIIGSIALLQSHRSLLGRLEEYCETVVFRDLGPIEGAPDLILSPLACIVITTLQAAQQRSLPGSKPGTAQSCPLHERLHRLSLTYQQIFVLTVTPSAEYVDSGIQSSGALASFSAFAARYSPRCQISLIMIPPMSHSDRDINEDNVRDFGLHHHLLEEIVLLVHDHGDGTEKDGYKAGGLAKLLQEETQWERWFKHAGLNPFAAQATIGLLEATNHHGLTALPALFRMSKVEREDLLGEVIGLRAVESLNARTFKDFTYA